MPSISECFEYLISLPNIHEKIIYSKFKSCIGYHPYNGLDSKNFEIINEQHCIGNEASSNKFF